MSPASQAPLIKTVLVSQGSQGLALGLAKTAASQLDEVRISKSKISSRRMPGNL